ncbi:CRISPR-associated protein Cas4 [Candidatus Woesearchaeota archaeon]|nr:CRISPR-associated protein Cas4 [Candidatus Woesearchaeota archaeon]
MKVLPATALSAWVSCPRQFFMQYVVGKEVRLNRAMALGLVKHKVHELVSREEERLVCALRSNDAVQQVLERECIALLRSAVVHNSNVLRSVQVTLSDAFQQSVAVAKASASDCCARVVPLLAQGLQGEALWHALVPKVKSEYAVQSKVLGLKGRIDRLEIHGARLVPVEIKSGKVPVDGVFDHHRIQVASYALLLEELFQTSVPEAIVHYVDGSARRSVVLNPFTRDWVLDVAAKARSAWESCVVPKGCGHDGCAACVECDSAAVLSQLEARREKFK